MVFKAHHFAYQHPIFGRSTIEKAAEKYRNSVYYLWWEFLRRNAAYKWCCKKGGKGRLNSLYTDFGDVFSADFKSWWQLNDRGARLFAEPWPPKFCVISNFIDSIKNSNVLYLQVPLALPKRRLEREFKKLLGKYHPGRRGIRNNANSSARYLV